MPVLNPYLAWLVDQVRLEELCEAERERLLRSLRVSQ